MVHLGDGRACGAHGGRQGSYLRGHALLSRGSTLLLSVISIHPVPATLLRCLRRRGRDSGPASGGWRIGGVKRFGAEGG